MIFQSFDDEVFDVRPADYGSLCSQGSLEPSSINRNHGTYLEKDMKMSEVKITIRENGPFLVTGPIELTGVDGKVYDLAGKETIALCRCGASANRPFCDGAHKACGFESSDKAE